jgi:ribosomal protein S7
MRKVGIALSAAGTRPRFSRKSLERVVRLLNALPVRGKRQVANAVAAIASAVADLLNEREHLKAIAQINRTASPLMEQCHVEAGGG